MSAQSIKDVVEEILREPENVWSWSLIQRLGVINLPDAVYLGNRAILEGDVKVRWVEWFVDALIDRDTLVRTDTGYAHVYKCVAEGTEHLFHLSPREERRAAAQALSRFAYESIKRRRERARSGVRGDERRSLVVAAGDPPKCQCCGFKFPKEAVDIFLGIRKVESKLRLPRYVDFAKPIGVYERDLKIEVDHLDPLSQGGSGGRNLQLLCGWCNRAKRDCRTLYDAGGVPKVSKRNVSTPHPFWVVRLLMLEGGTLSPGVVKPIGQGERTVAKRVARGAFNPTNMYVISYDEDPLEEVRWIPRKSM